jgi:sugar phosphate isomerase/epimerase
MKKKCFVPILILITCTGLIFIMNSCTPKEKYIGLQLYSLRDSIKKDLPGTIEKVGKIGYKFVEPADYRKGKFYGLEPAEFKKLCDKNHLDIISSHTSHNAPDSSNYDAVMAWWDSCITAHKALGVKYIVQSSMEDSAYKSPERLKAYCRYFNDVGLKCSNNGIKFGYHNHSREFTTMVDSSTVLYDYLASNTNPSLVTLEIDLYWCVQGGKNPVDYFNKYPGRFELWHIKDKAEVGASGQMDFQSFWENAAKAGLKYGIVEVEEYNYDTFTSVQKSLDFLNNADYVVLPKPGK